MEKEVGERGEKKIGKERIVRKSIEEREKKDDCEKKYLSKREKKED